MIKNQFTTNDLEKAYKCSLFKYCSNEQVSNYLNNIGVNIYDFAANEIIPSEIRCSSYGIIISGSVKVFSNDGGNNPLLLNVVSPYEVFDIVSLTGNNERTPLSIVKTAGKCRILFVPTCEITDLMKDYPEIAANCFRFFCGRIAFLNKKISTLSCGTSDQKLTEFLLNEFRYEDGQFLVRIKSCVELANRLNLSRASLYRAIEALENECIIKRDGKTIIIINIEKLQDR